MFRILIPDVTNIAVLEADWLCQERVVEGRGRVLFTKID
jgi:hypothetical protein